VSLLTLIDTAFYEVFKGEPYSGPVAFFVGAQNRFNPLRRFRSPEVGWRKLFPHGLRFEVLQGDSGRFDTAMRNFARVFPLAIDWAESMNCTAREGIDLKPFPDNAYRAQFKVVTSMNMLVGEAGTVIVKVRNTGSAVWTPESGIALGNHWLSSRGETLIWGDGRTPLSQLVGPGQVAELQLSIRAPSEAGVYLLEIDLVEEGVTWFNEKGARTSFVRVTVRPA
jgi:hypothetical protein